MPTITTRCGRKLASALPALLALLHASSARHFCSLHVSLLGRSFRSSGVIKEIGLAQQGETKSIMLFCEGNSEIFETILWKEVAVAEEESYGPVAVRVKLLKTC